MNGKALCLLPKESFTHRTAQSGDVLYEILQKLVYYNGKLVNNSVYHNTIFVESVCPSTKGCISYPHGDQFSRKQKPFPKIKYEQCCAHNGMGQLPFGHFYQLCVNIIRPFGNCEWSGGFVYTHS